MHQRFASVAKLAAVGAAFGLVAACATVDEDEIGAAVDREMEDLYAEMDETRAIAEDARDTAEGADERAAEAHSIAEEALRKAEDNEEKIDRMFERTMQK
ncbi:MULTISPECIES: Lpp/OprI family alanine-zipper lipoprotein [unclassified Halorhodospira]|uniref:Lpp/OprI family alanine-zipper lipoprotein n=1 Tax=unclassified Halorhodospira TaxID=2626748 RepID=UPI001EE818CF|nr:MULTISPECIES: Lpp/OprI family alanine-zipper lipoprotein [unclassified Halorhodospira]MCG5540053.1 Lpp/OprI family alanine-zipper lipoprotein [Halorhodospira sp. M39old]MCG5544861.1 Lpp/OprI family alanine-zipper lipoprotein [Halorhodospira sp. M38]